MGFFKKKEPVPPAAPVFGPVEYIVCGLGNPGSRYGNTRHNIGYCALDVLAQQCGARVDRSRFHAMTGEAMLDGRHILLMKPTTYMNLSGQAAQEALLFYKLPPERLIVLSDDISLPVGKMRIRTKGSAGGHNGLKDIILRLGSEEFPRIGSGWAKSPLPNMTWRTGFSASLPKRRAKRCCRCCRTPPKPAPSSCRGSRRRP